MLPSNVVDRTVRVPPQLKIAPRASTRRGKTEAPDCSQRTQWSTVTVPKFVRPAALAVLRVQRLAIAQRYIRDHRQRPGDSQNAADRARIDDRRRQHSRRDGDRRIAAEGPSRARSPLLSPSLAIIAGIVSW